MHTISDVRKTLESSAAFDTIKGLKLNKQDIYDPDCDLLLFDLYENTPFYYSIYDNVSRILEAFRAMSFERRKNRRGLNVATIGIVLAKMGEPWPDPVIATAIQYQLLKIENKFFSLSKIMKIEFFNLDVKFSDFSFAKRISVIERI